MRHRTLLVLATSWAALITPGVAAAQSQDGQSQVTQGGTTGSAGDAATGQARSAARADPGDIVVTARRREESLKDVPIAVTALGSGPIDVRGAI